MIICGDLSTPNAECTQKLIDDMKSSGVFQGQTILANLEGVIQKDENTNSFWKVYNHESVLNLKSVGERLIFSIANNHTYDYPDRIQETVSICNDCQIGIFGLYENEKIYPFVFSENGETYAVFGHCWNVYTKTNKNKSTCDHVIDCEYDQFFKVVVDYVKAHQDTKVICYFHWNFDLEHMPFPSYKMLSHNLIDHGVEAVIGNHAHVPQEVELYKGKVIAYGLGNFYMPDGFFFNGTLKYGKESHVCYVVELSATKAPVVHVFETDVDGKALVYNSIMQIPTVDSYFSKEHANYIKNYKHNRSKKKLTPVFKHYKDSFGNKLKTQFLILKIDLIRIIRKARDRKIQQNAK